MVPTNKGKVLFSGNSVDDIVLSDNANKYDYLMLLCNRGSSLEVANGREYYRTFIIDTSQEYHVLSYDIRSSANWYQITTKKIHLKDNKIEKVNESGLALNGVAVNVSDTVNAIFICKVIGYNKKKGE